ncbi:MAG TPA: 7-carboxy-7-deazaguanine synthase QueE [Candidatus Nitrosotenuis sp.]|nr:7-carboxy-7-deazaguanine synthase QueE [Candidatus Nitrosotenuis sp.]HII04252.1 7-carboxy-7-deazaguanine synthase QueE [Candidatus Nitrosotenuis sp.]
MKVRLFEIFTSLEGEGILYGTKTLFVRLAGCPFTCFYCDTKESLPMDSGNEYDITDACELIEKNLKDKTYKVNFTGGDPLVQTDAVIEMAKFVHSKKIPTYLESSCYDSKKFEKVLPHIDFVKVELKTKDSDFVDQKHYSTLIENALDCLKKSISAKKPTYVKIVVSAKTDLETFTDLTQKIFKITNPRDLNGFIIQPTYGIAEPTLQQLLNFYDVVYPYFSDVRVVPQLHKLIGAP